MRQYLTTALVGLSLAPLAMAGPSPIYNNPGTITETPTVDAVIFNNSGTFSVSTILSVSNLIASANILATPFPFTTSDTLYFTNTGTMTGIPGFQFDTATSTKRFSALSVANHGTIIAQDVPAIPDFVSVAGSVATTVLPQYSQPIPSQVAIYSTNVVNDGEIGVGNAGLLKIVSKNFTGAFGSLAAGGVNTGGASSLFLSGLGLQSETDPLDTTGRGETDPEIGYFVDPPGVYDLSWGSTNGGMLRVDQLAGELPGTPPINLGIRGLTGIGGIGVLQLGGNLQGYASYVYTFNSDPTNVYWEIVFVNTNFADPNISANVEFSQGLFNGIPQANFGDAIPPAAVVQDSVPTTDVLTGDLVTNAVYLIDSGAKLTNIVLLDNASTENNYDRPMCFDVTTVTPLEWQTGFAVPQTPFDPGVIYTGGSFVNNSVPFIAGEYGVQIGRNPETIDGSFATTLNDILNGTNLVGTNLTSIESTLLLDNGVSLPDPTNEAGRIDITAGQGDLSSARIRAEGIVMLNITNLVGAGSGASDWGMTDAKIGMTSGNLVLANLFPTNFQRLRGELNAWCATWQNVFTNAVTTNNYHMHVLVVDQVLRGNFRSTIRNLTLTGAKSINVQNDLTVISQSLFDTSNLVLNANVTLTSGAGNLYPANVPKLQTLTLNPGSSLSVDSVLDIGYDLTQVPGSPSSFKFSVQSIDNAGTITANAPLFQSAVFTNDGVIVAAENGSIAINASKLTLGSLNNPLTNYLVADGNVTLSAVSIQANNSAIFAGLGHPGSLTLDVTGNLSDGVSGGASVSPDLINYWQVSDGFNLPVKPTTGDLFGTEIVSMAGSNVLADHVWAGVDMGATAAGYKNNVVIGHLVLDRTAPSGTMRFSGAGAQNAMYVDYLELRDFSFSDYRNRLIIEPNLKIYFADANADPFKLMEVYPGGLIWVTNFTGPNSTIEVSNLVNSSICLMNAALYNSQEIGFFGIPNAYNRPYVLNNPSNPNIIADCPGEASVMSLFVTPSATPVPGALPPQSLTVSANGQGMVGPTLTQSQLVLGNSATLTATPSKGWIFANWTISGLGIHSDTNSPVLSFTVTPSAIVTANFVPIPFATLHGAFTGLFYGPSNVTSNNAGYFTMTLNPSGSFSGKLLIGSTTYSFASQFFGSGAQQVKAVSGKQSVLVNLHLDMNGGTDRITGDVNGGSWDSELSADLAPVWTTKNPSPLAGNYTVALTGAVGVGDSFGVVHVSSLGVVSVTGTLADGKAFTQSAPISKYGQWPLYAYVAAGKDTVLGWVDFNAGGPSSTNIAWVKSPGKGPYYAAGFDSLFQLVGSPYIAPKKSPTLSLSNPSIILSGGNLSSEIATPVTLQKNFSYASGGLTLSFNSTTGAFTGKNGQGQTMSGVVLQNQNSARGFFLGTTESGAVLLQGN